MKKKTSFSTKKSLKRYILSFRKKNCNEFFFFFNEQNLICKIKIAVSFKRATTSWVFEKKYHRNVWTSNFFLKSNWIKVNWGNNNLYFKLNEIIYNIIAQTIQCGLLKICLKMSPLCMSKTFVFCTCRWNIFLNIACTFKDNKNNSWETTVDYLLSIYT